MDKLIYFCSNCYTYIYYTTVDIFIGINPPCKECLIQSMCIITTDNSYDKQILRIKICEKLNKFMENSNRFDKR